MLLTKKSAALIMTLCLFFGKGTEAFAENTANDSISKYSSFNVSTAGYGSYEFGEVVKGDNEGAMVNHYWSHQVYAGLGFIANLNQKTELVAGVEGKMWNPYPSADAPGRVNIEQQYSLWLTGVYGTYSPSGVTGNSWLDLTVGYFPYKYNPDVRNLGEYMFRTMTYPGLIFNNFDFPAIRLLGFKLHVNIFDDFFSKFDSKLNSDLLITEEDQNWPFGDISISWLGSFNFKKIIDIGAGVDWANYISVNSFNTTPKFISGGGGNEFVTSVDSLGHRTYDSTQFYTFKAVKPMARLNIDPKPLFGDFGHFFGKEDLKLYGEACIIGLQDYPYYYANISERIPIMFGFNFPTCNIFDVLNIEVEHYSSRLNTSNKNQIYPAGGSTVFVTPVPEGIADSIPGILTWKWSVYVKKTLMPRVSIVLQFAHDHYRLNYIDGNPVFAESLSDKGDWRWVAKIVGNL